MVLHSLGVTGSCRCRVWWIAELAIRRLGLWSGLVPWQSCLPRLAFGRTAIRPTSRGDVAPNYRKFDWRGDGDGRAQVTREYVVGPPGIDFRGPVSPLVRLLAQSPTVVRIFTSVPVFAQDFTNASVDRCGWRKVLARRFAIPASCAVAVRPGMSYRRMRQRHGISGPSLAKRIARTPGMTTGQT